MQPDLFSGIQGADGEAIDLSLPVLSIRQPWAQAIVEGLKDVENRTWRTNVRGPVLVHAGKARETIDLTNYLDLKADRGITEKLGLKWKDLNFGGIIGVVEIVDCVQVMESPWFVGPWGFVLKNARALPFYPCRGALGFFKVKGGA